MASFRRAYPITMLFFFLLLLNGCTGPSRPGQGTKMAPTGESPASTSGVQAVSLGQDGADFAGELCSSGTAADNIHIHLSGLRTDEAPVGYRLVDGGMGVWANPCDPQSNWLLFVNSTARGEADLYFKPYQSVPDGAQFTLTVTYGNGESQVVTFRATGTKSGLTATFLGQDGGSFAGKLCSSGTAKDNVHIRLNGLRTDAAPESVRVEEQGGLWATPCDPVSNWFLYVSYPAAGQADLYFKPYRDAPDGTRYSITVRYNDGTSKTISVKGLHVKP